MLPVAGFYWKSPSIAGLILLSGVFSGLTLGLLSLDLASLKFVIQGGSPQPHAHAKRVYAVRKHGNWLMCTLLLGNVCVNSALTMLVDDVFSDKSQFCASLAFSICVITVLGEIIPQASCARHGLLLGSYTASLVMMLMGIFAPIAYPLGKGLDCALGVDLGRIYNNAELKELILFHVSEKKAELGEDAGKMMAGALDFGTMAVKDVMTPWEDVFHLPITAKLTFDVLKSIFKSGHSRIPYTNERGQPEGLVFAKDLILLDPEDELPITTIVDIYARDVSACFLDTPLTQVLREFRSGKSHLAIVQKVNNAGPGDPFYETVGIVTLEDIIETILKVEIVDETDVYINAHGKHPVVDRKEFDLNKLSRFDY
eukprot:748104_1